MVKQTRTGFTLTETLIIGAVFGLFLIGSTLLLGFERSRTRDAKRVADITRLAGGFALLFAEKASYADAAAGCSTIGANAATCSLSDVVSGLDTLKDPGSFRYVISEVPNRDNFGVQFRLERSYGSLTAGTHTLSRTGIR